MFATRPETQIEIEKLTAALNSVMVGEVLTYDSIEQRTGIDLKARRFSLIKARRIVERETGLRFETVHGVGIKKLDGRSVIGIGQEARKKIARTAKVQSSRLINLKYNDIDASMQARIDAERSLLGAISAVASDASIKKIEDTARTGPVVAQRVLGALAN